MAHFAQLDGNNLVTQVIVVSNEVINNEAFPQSEPVGVAFCQSLYGADTRWAQTSYNGSFRYNYAGIGFLFDATAGAFIPPKPYPSWLLNTNTFQWQAPVPYPDDGLVYEWDESTVSWKRVYTSWIPTDPSTISTLMSLSALTSSDVFFDMGSGDGRVLVSAISNGAAAKGVDIDPIRVAQSSAAAPSAQVYLGDLINADFSTSSVLFLAMDAPTILYMHPKLMAAKAGTRVFYLPRQPMSFSGTQPTRVEQTEDGPLYMWVV